MELRDDADGWINVPLGWRHDKYSHALALTFQDYLLRVWRGETMAQYRESLQILLGIEKESRVKSKWFDDDPLNDSKFAALITSVKRLYPGYRFALSRISTNWSRGEFSYQPLNDFQRAVYALWRESWRARTCSVCGKLFIAQKPPQLYCGVECSSVARRKRDLALWRAKHQKKRGRKGGKP